MSRQRFDEIYQQALVKGDIARRHTERLSPAGVEAAIAAGLDASAERVISDVVEEAYDAGQRDASLSIAHSMLALSWWRRMLVGFALSEQLRAYLAQHPRGPKVKP